MVDLAPFLRLLISSCRPIVFRVEPYHLVRQLVLGEWKEEAAFLLFDFVLKGLQVQRREQVSCS